MRGYEDSIAFGDYVSIGDDTIATKFFTGITHVEFEFPMVGAIKKKKTNSKLQNENRAILTRLPATVWMKME
jgi:hypothetical protein